MPLCWWPGLSVKGTLEFIWSNSPFSKQFEVKSSPFIPLFCMVLNNTQPGESPDSTCLMLTCNWQCSVNVKLWLIQYNSRTYSEISVNPEHINWQLNNVKDWAFELLCPGDWLCSKTCLFQGTLSQPLLYSGCERQVDRSPTCALPADSSQLLMWMGLNHVVSLWLSLTVLKIVVLSALAANCSQPPSPAGPFPSAREALGYVS